MIGQNDGYADYIATNNCADVNTRVDVAVRIKAYWVSPLIDGWLTTGKLKDKNFTVESGAYYYGYHIHLIDTTNIQSDVQQHWYTCEEVGCTAKIGAAKHVMSEWETTLTPTEKSEGEQIRECLGCEYRESKALPKLPSSSNESSGTGNEQEKT